MNLTFKIITDTSFPKVPLDVCYLDGFFVVINGGTNNFQLSQFNQGMVWGVAENTFTAPGPFSPSSPLINITTTANYPTGLAVTLTTTGSLPGGLAVSTTYYVININSDTIELATSFANAEAVIPIPIQLTSAGSGVQTIRSSGTLQLASITSHPGTLVACRTLHRKLFLFSQFYTEVWENQGAANFPFRRMNSVLIELGTPAIGSVSVGFDKMIFLSQDRDGLGAVVEVDGVTATPISTRALDFQLSQYAALQQVADCRGFLIKENGLIFYRMNFTLADHTYVYNVTLSNPSSDQTKLWHEEETLTRDRHVSQTHAYFNGMNFVGHYLLPILYILDPNTYTNDGTAIPRKRFGRPIGPQGYQRTRIDRFQLDLLQGNVAFIDYTGSPINIITNNQFEIITNNGLFLITNQPLETSNQEFPEVFFSYSKDGGQTFGNQLIGTMGKVGDRKFRTIWRKLGVIPRGQYFVPKIEFFNNGPFIVLGASWSYETLPQ
jgi:hypothetical protein